MELNSKKIDFSNKTELVKLLDKFHDSTCNFKVIDEKKLKITFYTIEGEIRYILKDPDLHIGDKPYLSEL